MIAVLQMGPSCSFTVVNDTQPPSITRPPTLQARPQRQAPVWSGELYPTASDNCPRDGRVQPAVRHLFPARLDDRDLYRYRYIRQHRYLQLLGSCLQRLSSG
jgi:hypothetical protein